MPKTTDTLQPPLMNFLFSLPEAEKGLRLGFCCTWSSSSSLNCGRRGLGGRGDTLEKRGFTGLGWRKGGVVVVLLMGLGSSGRKGGGGGVMKEEGRRVTGDNDDVGGVA